MLIGDESMTRANFFLAPIIHLPLARGYTGRKYRFSSVRRESVRNRTQTISWRGACQANCVTWEECWKVKSSCGDVVRLNRSTNTNSLLTDPYILNGMFASFLTLKSVTVSIQQRFVSSVILGKIKARSISMSKLKAINCFSFFCLFLTGTSEISFFIAKRHR